MRRDVFGWEISHSLLCMRTSWNIMVNEEVRVYCLLNGAELPKPIIETFVILETAGT